MFTPSYTLTSELLQSISRIERLYGQLEALRIPRELELNLTRKNQISSAYISNSMEGNPLSLAEVTNLILDDRIPTNRDEKEIINYFEILTTLHLFVDRPLSLSTIKEIHQKLLTNVNDAIAGTIRNQKVVVGNYVTENGVPVLRVKHEPPFHQQSEIESVLSELITWITQENDLPPLIKIGIFHHQFVYIHPFADGNGRSCRLLTALLFLMGHYEINKYFVLDDYYDVDRFLYSDKLNSADQGDKTEWLIYFCNGVVYSLQSALSRIKTGLQNISIDMRPTPKEQEVLALLKEKPQLTSMDVSSTLHISRQQAHKLLSQLVAKKLLIKKGNTKASYYMV